MIFRKAFDQIVADAKACARFDGLREAGIEQIAEKTAALLRGGRSFRLLLNLLCLVRETAVQSLKQIGDLVLFVPERQREFTQIQRPFAGLLIPIIRGGL